jgi:hypothetical protein
MISLPDVQGLVAHWWYSYDEGQFEVLEALLTEDVHFSCESDTGQTAFEEFIRCDRQGRASVMEWQTDHRLNSPYPLRHSGTNVHVTSSREGEAGFASYLVVTQIVAGAVSPLSTGLARGTARREADGIVRLSSLRVTLDTMNSAPLSEIRAARTPSP